ncbi:hypothetical protein RUM43_013741 [Polyplax serrata]|uniref:Ras-associating domain-containing protein n=1 Tax=Polyplax serrata TaxID=468196 RepID=A0AAN8S662_POLSC
MELKVWVEGIQRIVCGVTEQTTCQDVVYALAHATGKTGRFTLNERWRSNERLLSPQDQPLKILMKWGKYSNDVQFVLQRSQSNENKAAANDLNQIKQKPGQNDKIQNFNASFYQEISKSPGKNKDVKKSLTLGGNTVSQISAEEPKTDNIGIVRGIPQQNYDLDIRDLRHTLKFEDTISNVTPKSENGLLNYQSTQLKREAPPYRNPPGPNNSSNVQQRVLPPYRDPPPPTLSPSKSISSGTRSVSPSSNSSFVSHSSGKLGKPKRNLVKELQSSNSSGENSYQETVLPNSQYRDLVRLINLQREKLSTQQCELTKFDAEIIYWETKTKEQQHQIEYIAEEKSKIENISRQNEDHIRTLVHAEEEFEIVRQQEKTLKSEISLLRSKLANCETELLQCKNKIRLLMDDLQMERMAALRETDERQHLERTLISEVERFQNEIDQAKQATELSVQCSDNLKREVTILESIILERKHQLEQLINEMKEANLQSLVIAPPEDLKHIIEGPCKPGITRKMIGSPRQLENAVPTSKNPHGVWV